jgi:hypothetical protein
MLDKGEARKIAYFKGGAGTCADAVTPSICRCRQAGHQQPACSPGSGTAGGKVVHQQGSLPPSAIAQPNGAPQRVQILIGKASSFACSLSRPGECELVHSVH